MNTNSKLIVSIAGSVVVFLVLIFGSIIANNDEGIKGIFNKDKDSSKIENLSVSDPMQVTGKQTYDAVEEFKVQNGVIVHIGVGEDMVCPEIVEKAYKDKNDKYILVIKSYSDRKDCSQDYGYYYEQKITRTNNQPIPQNAQIEVHRPKTSSWD